MEDVDNRGADACVVTEVIWEIYVSWTARRSNQSILKEISPGISLEGLMLKLKLHGNRALGKGSASPNSWKYPTVRC